MVDVVFGSLVLVLSIGLMLRHRAVHRSWALESWNKSEQDYHQRQYRRRMLTSAMIGVVGVLLFAGSLITDPVAAVLHGLGLMILVVWILLMAISDFKSTRDFYEEQRDGFLRERAALDAELKRLRRRQGNGQAEDARN